MATPTDPAGDARAERFYAAVVVGLGAAVLLYVAFRLAEVALMPEPSPAVALWSARSGFLWRLLLAAYVGGAIAIEAHALLRRASLRARVVRHLPMLVAIAAASILVQAWACP